MVRKLFILFAFTAFLVSCNNSGKKSANSENTESNQAEEQIIISVAEFHEKAGEFVGKEINISGIVDRTCKHSGKRMFIVNEGSDEVVKIEAGDNISSFDAELEGSDVSVVGIVTEKIVDIEYLDEWESEIIEEKESNLKLHDGNHEKNKEGEEEENYEEDLEKIKNLRERIAESGTDHLSFYSIECLSFEVIK